MTDDEWIALKLALPVGSTVEGRVVQRERFGFFVELSGYQDGNAVVLAPDLEAGSTTGAGPTDPARFPPIGARVEAEVLDHVDLTMQLRLFVARHER